MEELRDILNSDEGGADETVLVECEGTTYKVNLTENNIYFLNNQDEKHCIHIEVYEDSVYLSDYYLTEDIDADCPKLPHELFFNFLTALGHLLKRPVTLLDFSFKALEHTFCYINSEIFSLSGARTFYERFGFRNARYKRAINKLRKLRVEELVDLHATRQSRRTNRNPMRMQELLAYFGMGFGTSVETVAKYIIMKCKSSHVYNKEYLRRGYDRDDVTMVKTRRFRLPEHDTALINELMLLLKYYVRGTTDGIESHRSFTLEGTEQYARD
jgi:hypothetical protein